MHAQRGAGDAQGVERAHHMAPAAIFTRLWWSVIARVSTWYWNCDWTAASVSLRRSTLLPFAPTGVSVAVRSMPTPLMFLSARWEERRVGKEWVRKGKIRG